MGKVKELWVNKFGGTSLANAAQIMKVREIVFADERRKVVVVSAPGKEHKEDTKVTDLLLNCHRLIDQGGSFDPLFEIVRKRVLTIARDLNADNKKIEGELDKIYIRLKTEKSPDYAASRGEYLNALMIAQNFEATFIDAAEIIFLTKEGHADEKSYDKIKERLEGIEGRIVVPGFYGTGPNGEIKTFSRGGSDISGSLLAKALGASLYENWTDVSGVYVADPRVALNATAVKFMTYREIRELATIGASVLHEDAIAPLKSANIPLNVKNTNDPLAAGTMIVQQRDTSIEHLVGVSGKKPYRKIVCEKYMLMRNLSAKEAITAYLRENGYLWEIELESFDTITYYVHGTLKESDTEAIKTNLLRFVDICEVSEELVLIGLVGEAIEAERNLISKISERIDSKFEIISSVSPIKMLLVFALKEYERALNTLVDIVVGK